MTLSGAKIDRPLDALGPVGVGLSEHSRDQIDVYLREPEVARLTVDPANFRRAVRAAVQFENAIAQVSTPRLSRVTPMPRIAASLGRVMGPWGLALEGDFLGGLP